MRYRVGFMGIRALAEHNSKVRPTSAGNVPQPGKPDPSACFE